MDNDWNKKVFSWDFNKLAIHGCPSWDLHNEHPYYVHMVCDEKGSRDIAIEWDNDLSFCGNFYYRDWTKSGIPFISDGEIYWSGFWFQKQKDAVEFQKRYGGVGSWQDGYDEFMDKCKEARGE